MRVRHGRPPRPVPGGPSQAAGRASAALAGRGGGVKRRTKGRGNRRGGDDVELQGGRSVDHPPRELRLRGAARRGEAVERGAG